MHDCRFPAFDQGAVPADGASCDNRALVRKQQSSYRPHEDRGWLRTRLADIRRELTDIDRLVHSPGIRTLEDQQRLGGSYLKIALDH